MPSFVYKINFLYIPKNNKKGLANILMSDLFLNEKIVILRTLNVKKMAVLHIKYRSNNESSIICSLS